MVSQVICVVCSVLPQPHTTEITFYKFPKSTESPTLFKAWQNALVTALSNERPEFSDDLSLIDTYVCSQHFTESDISFENGKLVLLKDAVPSRLTKNLYESEVSKPFVITSTKEYEPSNRSNNFASTLTKDFVTTSRNNLCSDLVCTETSRVLTPNVSEFITAMACNSASALGFTESNKRHIELEHKIESFGKIFKRLRYDNVLTESYVDKLKVITQLKLILHKAQSIFFNFNISNSFFNRNKYRKPRNY